MATEVIDESSPSAPLPSETRRDLHNKYYYINHPSTTKSQTCISYRSPILSYSPTDPQDGTGFDCHIYFDHTSPQQTTSAESLHKAIRLTFPELRTYTIHYGLAGPHTTGSFEVDLWTPEQFGAFLPWLVVNRGELSVLVHPNSDGEGEEKRDHLERGIWFGERKKTREDFFN